MALGLVSCIVRGTAALAIAPPAALGVRRCTSGRTLNDFARSQRQISPRAAGARMAALKKPMNHSSLADFPDFGGAGKLIKMAYKANKEVKLNPKITNSKKQAQSFAAARIDAYTSTITKALKEKQKTFHDMKRRLRPFESEMAELSQKALERSGGRSLKRVMDDFDLMRRAVVRAGKEASSAASKAEHKRAALDLAEEGIASVRLAFESNDEAMLELAKTVSATPAPAPSPSPTPSPSPSPSPDAIPTPTQPQSSSRPYPDPEREREQVTALRRLPRVEQGEPVLVLVGMPNVGKSSLVTATSTGTPEINMYPFTTRSLKMGHVITPGHRYQLMDTPGVLRREEDERNAMEGLTLASAPYI
jgi:GTP1/Obg family GTP-binding protein